LEIKTIAILSNKIFIEIQILVMKGSASLVFISSEEILIFHVDDDGNY